MFSDALNESLFHHEDLSFQRTDFIASFQHKFSLDEPAKEALHDENHWALSFPHEKSGPCHTYNPLHESDTGLKIGLYIVMKDKSWDPALEIFLHTENRLYYSFNLRSDFFLKPITLEKANINPTRLKGKHFTKRKLT